MFCDAMNFFKKDLSVTDMLDHLAGAHSVERIVGYWPIGLVEVKDLIHAWERVDIDTEGTGMFFGAAAEINNFHEAQTKGKIP